MDKYTGFISANGRFLMDECGKQYLIKGMAFGNNVWTNPDTAPIGLHHTENSYKELSDIGFNSVRFYLNYGLFENDDEPYIYKESGFEWIDKNIEWAKKYGMRIVLNMHYPQGGYQSQGNGRELWDDAENQERLAALWKEIARRYADEPYILGYGILNEPVVPANDAVKGTEMWYKLMIKIMSEIRSVDKSHIIFIENILAFQDENSGEIDWNTKNDEYNFAVSDDKNVIYEFHFYSPHSFTHQGFKWANTAEYDKIYPNEQEVFADGVSWHAGTFNGGQYDLDNTEWQYLESDQVTVTSENQILNYVFQAQEIGENGIAYVDDVAITEYDADGNHTRIIYANNFDQNCPMNFWASNNVGSGEYVFTRTHSRKKGGSYLVQGTTDDASGSIGYFKPMVGRSYKASGYFRVCSANENAMIRPRVDIWEAESISFLNKEYLRKNLHNYVDFSRNHNVPIYCGEFGTGSISFENGRGGSQWVSDVIDIFNDYKISFSYHTYHEESFGLYLNDPLKPPSEKNELLYDILSRKLSEK